jgi:caffeoyl-CoA O-methyltransferase
LADYAVDPDLSAYTETTTTRPPDFMARLAEETRATLPVPEMLTGHVEGRFLEVLAFATGARRILELGTYSGYSALSMAAGMPEDGRITTCEFSDENADFAQRHIDASPFAEKIEIRRGPALDTIATVEGTFDLIFIDADKSNYPNYFAACLPLLADRGLMVLDNTLWSGRVLEGRDDGSDNTRMFRELNARIAADERVIAVQLSVRDGITLVRKRLVA